MSMPTQRSLFIYRFLRIARSRKNSRSCSTMRKLRLYGAASIQPPWSRLAAQVILDRRQALVGKDVEVGTSDFSTEDVNDKRLDNVFGKSEERDTQI